MYNKIPVLRHHPFSHTKGGHPRQVVSSQSQYTHNNGSIPLVVLKVSQYGFSRPGSFSLKGSLKTGINVQTNCCCFISRDNFSSKVVTCAYIGSGVFFSVLKHRRGKLLCTYWILSTIILPIHRNLTNVRINLSKEHEHQNELYFGTYIKRQAQAVLRALCKEHIHAMMVQQRYAFASDGPCSLLGYPYIMYMSHRALLIQVDQLRVMVRNRILFLPCYLSCILFDNGWSHSL